MFSQSLYLGDATLKDLEYKNAAEQYKSPRPSKSSSSKPAAKTLGTINKSTTESESSKMPPVESLEFIEESPTNKTSTINFTTRSMRKKLNTNKKVQSSSSSSNLIKPKSKNPFKKNKSNPPPVLATNNYEKLTNKTNSENYSEYFVSQLNFNDDDDNNKQLVQLPQDSGPPKLKPETIVPESPTEIVNTSLDKYFTDSLGFESQKKVIETPAAVTTSDLNQSDMFLPINNSLKNILDNGISVPPTNLVDNNFFDDSSFNISKYITHKFSQGVHQSPVPETDVTKNPMVSHLSVAAATLPSPPPPTTKPVKDSQKSMWGDDDDDDDHDLGNVNDFFGCEIKNPTETHQTDLLVEEDVALGIDNVTFTQSFLRQRSYENDLNKDTKLIDAVTTPISTSTSRLSTIITQKSASEFIREQMDKCEKQVKIILAENDKQMDSQKLHNHNDSYLMAHLNIKPTSANSSIHLNWSSDSVANSADISPLVTNNNNKKIKNKTNKNDDQRLGKKSTAAAAPLTSIMPTVNLNLIKSWGLPEVIVEKYHKKGISEMFDWQVECLKNTKVLFDGANLVYSAPTSAGKTLVSEILMIKNILEQKKKSLLILPFVSIVREKMFYLQDLLSSADIQVEGFYGGYQPPGGFERTKLSVCTIEKANSIINKLLTEEKIHEIGCIVVDEIHLISDPGRGYILELLLAKILYTSQKFNLRIQIITMSATLPNLNLLTKWLKAEFYITNFRPVELCEMIKIDNEIFDKNMKKIRQIKPLPELSELPKDLPKDQDQIGQLCAETILNGCSVIVFCPSKDWCESLCKHLAGFIYAIGKMKNAMGERLREQINMENIEELKLQLKNSPCGLDKLLEKTISYGCAYHHAGLTTDEREILENGFKLGTIKIIIATSTLSSGVNLPARRVIIRTPLFGGKTMNSMTYKQMIGRAGRTGKDTAGESILICNKQNEKSGRNLITAELIPLSSALDVDNHVNLKRALLEIIASGMATTKLELECFTNCTLLASERNIQFIYEFNEDSQQQRTIKLDNLKDKSVEQPTNTDDPIAMCMKFLLKYEFIRTQLNDAQPTTATSSSSQNRVNFIATRLGLACLAASMPPGDGFLLFSELQRSRQNFVLESELHAVYLVTPFSVCYQMADIDWLAFLDMWEKLPSAMRRVGDMVGVKDAFLVKAMRGHKLDYKSLQIHKRFYTAMALQELVNERPVTEVAEKFKCSRGLLQSMQQMASTFAGVVNSFCLALNWQLMALIISQFKERLFFGIHRDLLDLMKITNLNCKTARALYSDGNLKTLVELANADVLFVEKILFNSIDFDCRFQRDGETEFDANKRNKMRFLYVTGKSGVTLREAARLIIEDARKCVSLEMGIMNIEWGALKSEEDEDELKKGDDGGEKKTDDGQENKKNDDDEAKKNEDEQKVIVKETEDIFKINSGIKNNNNNNKDIVPSSPKLEHRKRKSNEEINELITTVGGEPIKRKSPSFLSRIAKHSSNYKKNTPVAAILTNRDSPITTPITIDPITSIIPVPITSCMSETLNVSHILNINKFETTKSINLSQLKIINVFGDSIFFEEFQKTLENINEISMAIGISQNHTKTQPKIGENLLIKQIHNSDNENIKLNCLFTNDSLYLSGIAICFDETSLISYYLDLQQQQITDTTKKIPTISERIKFIETIFKRTNLTIKMYNAKEQLKALIEIIPTLIKQMQIKIEDPRITNWLLEPEWETCNLKEMAHKYATELVALTDLANDDQPSSASSININSISMNYKSLVNAKLRASIECCTVLHVLIGQKEHLERLGTGDILKSFISIEMPIQMSLCRMEIIGMAVDKTGMLEFEIKLTELISKLEMQIFKLNGRRFNILSSNEVAKVLGMRSNKLINQNKISTAKGILEKLNDPLSVLILQYRKLGATLTKTIRPLIRMIVQNRIHGNSISFTSTGRISMHEPNLQNIAKDFDVEIESKSYPISCRSIFKAPMGRILLSADFCQLELRILTHLSEDSVLMEIMRSGKDVFTTIAAKWNGITENLVTEKQRNDTKQICYGIIYGMGNKSLSEALKCDEDSAKQLSQSFHQTYPGIKQYTDKIIKFVHKTGYVETLAGRRRYFAQINSDNLNVRSQAERQAVNTTIQGSAADIAKYAILRMERNIKKYENNLGINLTTKPRTDVNLVLHLHDELLYELPEDKIKLVGKILKFSMENCAKLQIPLLVKVKSGSSWGTMNILEL